VINFTADDESKHPLFHPYFLKMIADKVGVDAIDIIDMELQLIDCQPASMGGINDEFINSGRLDNLCSAYQCTRALIDNSESITSQKNICMVALFDHEEVGSSSLNGAGSSIFMDTLTLINESLTDGSSGTLLRSLRTSFLVSADMAHAQHPNYPGKHDSSMAPTFNNGMVIKTNANQRYATNSVSASLFREAGRLAGVPVQEFTVRSDMGCGSTIGPILSTLSGILTVDCGSPQYSMHSIRETMAASDAFNGYLHLKGLLAHHPTLAIAFQSL
jgi:aspartyl aminopeptidase